jgi:hypothetical protein
MTFISESQGAEVNTYQELYHFQYGSKHYYYTNGTTPIIYANNEYLPRPLKREAMRTNAKLEPVRVTIKAPITELFQKFFAGSPSEPIKVTISAYYISTTSLYNIFVGNILDITFAEHTATATCEADGGFYRIKIPKIKYQAACNNTVFDSNCSLNSNNFKVTKVVTGKDGSTLIIVNTHSSGYFTGGMCKYDTDMRLIVKHDGNNIHLQAPFSSSLTIGTTIYLYPGCDRQASTCKNKFNNFSNFIGFPYIPNSNPTIWGIK